MYSFGGVKNFKAVRQLIMKSIVYYHFWQIKTRFLLILWMLLVLTWMYI